MICDAEIKTLSGQCSVMNRDDAITRIREYFAKLYEELDYDLMAHIKHCDFCRHVYLMLRKNNRLIGPLFSEIRDSEKF